MPYESRTIFWQNASGKQLEDPRGTSALVEGILRAGVGKIKPLLRTIDPQHDRQPYRLAAVARLRIVRFELRFQFTPRNHDVHHVQKLFPTALARMVPAHLSGHAGRSGADYPTRAGRKKLQASRCRSA